MHKSEIVSIGYGHVTLLPARKSCQSSAVKVRECYQML